MSLFSSTCLEHVDRFFSILCTSYIALVIGISRLQRFTNSHFHFRFLVEWAASNWIVDIPESFSSLTLLWHPSVMCRAHRCRHHHGSFSRIFQTCTIFWCAGLTLRPHCMPLSVGTYFAYRNPRQLYNGTRCLVSLYRYVTPKRHEVGLAKCLCISTEPYVVTSQNNMTSFVVVNHFKTGLNWIYSVRTAQ